MSLLGYVDSTVSDCSDHRKVVIQREICCDHACTLSSSHARIVETRVFLSRVRLIFYLCFGDLAGVVRNRLRFLQMLFLKSPAVPLEGPKINLAFMKLCQYHCLKSSLF